MPQVTCTICRGRSQHTSAEKLMRKRWTCVDGLWHCPRVECQARAHGTPAQMAAGDYFTEMKRVMDRHSAEFERIFKVPLADYFRLPDGLDVVKLDDRLIQSGDKCMYTRARWKFGKGASGLLQTILDDEQRAARTCVQSIACHGGNPGQPAGRLRVPKQQGA